MTNSGKKATITSRTKGTHDIHIPDPPVPEPNEPKWFEVLTENEHGHRTVHRVQAADGDGAVALLNLSSPTGPTVLDTREP